MHTRYRPDEYNYLGWLGDDWLSLFSWLMFNLLAGNFSGLFSAENEKDKILTKGRQ